MIGFEYTVIRRRRKRHLTLTVSSDNTVSVSVPKRISEKEIKEFVLEKIDWVKQKISHNKKTKKPYVPKQFIEGEEYLLLGQPYSLVIKQAPRARTQAETGILKVGVPKRTRNVKNYVQSRIIDWYKQAAFKILLKRISMYEKAIGVNITDLKIKTLKSSWAHCTRKGAVTFSWSLVMAPLNIVDYVVVHELCHLIHLNHSQRFWSKVAAIIPNYKQCKKWLLVNENTLRL